MAASKSLTIILSTVIPVVFVIGLVLGLWRYGLNRNSRLFNRGITPIADEEIESWKNDRHDEEKEPIPETPRSNSYHKSRRHHQQNSSVSSCQKPPSVIVYQNNSRISSEQSPRSFGPVKHSIDLPQTPVLARAPNARPGLTDDTVQGDDAFVPQLKRQPSRLSKNHASQHQRHKSAYGAVSATAPRDRWYGQPAIDLRTRQSADNIPRRGSAPRSHERIYSATENRPRMSLDEATSPGGLSPRPLLQKHEIGRAIG